MQNQKIEYNVLLAIAEGALSNDDIASKIDRSKDYVCQYVFKLKNKKLIEKDTEVIYGIRYKLSHLGITHLTKRAADLAKLSAKISALVGTPSR